MADTDPYTKIPNALLDRMAELGNAELRVLLAIVRRTAGWQKECDVISVSQLATATGLTSRNTQRAIEALLASGYIEREHAGKQKYCYKVKPYPLGTRLEDHIPTEHGETISPRDTEPYPLGTRLSDKPYPLGITQKKDHLKKEIKRERTRAPAQTNLDQLHEGVTIFKRLTGKRTVAPAIAIAIADKVTDCQRFEAAAVAWIKAGYKPDNLTGIFDWYDHPEKMERRNGTHPPSRHATATHSGSKPKRYDK